MNSQPTPATYNSNWELLGSLELPLGNGQNQTIHEWLNILLEPIHLHEDILHKVETSLQEAAERATEVYITGNDHHIHLRIYLPAKRTSKSETWSFFRVEKFEEQIGDGILPEHATELYLYLETH